MLPNLAVPQTRPRAIDLTVALVSPAWLPPSTLSKSVFKWNGHRMILYPLPTPFPHLSGHPSTFCLYLRSALLNITLIYDNLCLPDYPTFVQLELTFPHVDNPELQLDTLPTGAVLKDNIRTTLYNLDHIRTAQ